MKHRILKALLIVAAVSGVVHAESNETDWSNVTSLKSGTKVEVRTNSKRITGAVEAATPDTLTLRTKHGETKMTRSEVERVSTVSASRRKRALVAGAIGGPAAGAAVTVASHDPLHLANGPVADAPGGSEIGAAVGTLTGAPHTVYRKAK